MKKTNCFVVVLLVICSLFIGTNGLMLSNGTKLFTPESIQSLVNTLSNSDIKIVRLTVPLPKREMTLSIVAKEQLLWVQPYALLFTFGTLNKHLSVTSLQFLPIVTLNIDDEIVHVNTTQGGWKLIRDQLPGSEYGSFVTRQLWSDLRMVKDFDGYLVCFSNSKPTKGREDIVDSYRCRKSTDVDTLSTVGLDPFLLATMFIFHILKFFIAAYLFYYVISKMRVMQDLAEELAEHQLYVSNSSYDPPLFQNIFPRLLPLKVRVNFHVWEIMKLFSIHFVLYFLAIITILTRLFWPTKSNDSKILSVSLLEVKIPVVVALCITNALCTITKLFFSSGTVKKEQQVVPEHLTPARTILGHGIKIGFGTFTSAIVTSALCVANYYTCQPYSIPLYVIDFPLFALMFVALSIAFTSSETKGWNVQGRILLQFVTCGMYKHIVRKNASYKPKEGSFLKKIFLCIGWLLDSVWVVTLFMLGMNTGVVLFRLALCTMANLTIDTNTVALYSFFISVGTTLYSFIGDVEKPFESVRDFLIDKRTVKTYDQIDRENNGILALTDKDVDAIYIDKSQGRFRNTQYRIPITWRQYLELCDMAGIEKVAQAKILQFVLTLVILSVFFLGLSSFDPRFIGGDNKQLFTIISSSFLPLVPTLMKYLQGRNSDLASKGLQNRLQKSLEKMEREQRALLFNDQTGKQLVKDVGFELCLIDSVTDRQKALQTIGKVKRVIGKFKNDGEYRLFPSRSSSSTSVNSDHTETLLQDSINDL